jgi:prepilin-type N-terminal cleavage/methylation domain-containing protein
MSRATFGDRGFTLIELLLSITILGIIVASITGAIFVMLQTTQFTLDRPSGSQGTVQDALFTSHDQQLADTYFSADVASSKAISATRPPCSLAVTGAVNIVTFSWQDSDGAAPTAEEYAWYYLLRPQKPDGTADLTKLAEVRRAFCVQSLDVPPVVTARTTATIARSVGPTAPVVACDGHALPCVTDAAVGTPTKVVALQLRLGIDSAVMFGVQGQRRMTTA